MRFMMQSYLLAVVVITVGCGRLYTNPATDLRGETAESRISELIAERSADSRHIHRGGDDRLRPFGHAWRIAHRNDRPIHHVKHEKRCRRRTSGWISFRAVVEHSKFSYLWQQPDQIDAAAFVPLANLILRNIVSAPRHPRTNTRDVEFGSRESDVPHSDLESLCERLQKESRDCFSPKSRFDGEYQALRNGLLEEALTFLPRGYIGVALGNVGIR